METTMNRSSSIDIKAALIAGLAAGAVFLVLEMAMVAIFLGMSPWAPPRMIAAMLMGRGVLPPPATFDLMVVMVAMAIHFALSIVLAFVFAFLAKGRTVGIAIAIGAIFGLVLYLVNFYGMTAAFPWFAEARNWVSVFVHIMFGVVLGAVYAWRAGQVSRRAAVR